MIRSFVLAALYCLFLLLSPWVSKACLIPPSVPTGLDGIAVSPSQIDLTWNASTDTEGLRACRLPRPQGWCGGGHHHGPRLFENRFFINKQFGIKMIQILISLVGICAVFLCGLSFCPDKVLAENHHYDVIVVGGGTSGVAVAIQSARMGSKVALFEETDWVGGQMTAAGVANMDEGGYPASGIYKEFLDRAKNYYHSLNPPKSVGTCYFSDKSNCFEPSVARTILDEMMQETRKSTSVSGRDPSPDVYLMTNVADVIKDGSTVKGIITADGEKYHAKVLIDATECGDIIPMTGARYRVGNLTSDQVSNPTFSYDKSYVKTAGIQSITYSAILKYYPDGIPDKLRIKSAPPGYDEQINKIFRSRVSRDGDGKGTWSWSHHSGYRGMPNSDPKSPDALAGSESGRKKISKTGLNYANDYPWIMDLSKADADISDPYPLSVRYLLDSSYRKATDCKAKLRSLQFIYYAQDELNQSWTIAPDEGYAGEYNLSGNDCPEIPEYRSDLKAIENHMPVRSYVRESIRIIGIHTLTAKEIKRVGYEGVDTPPYRAEIQFGSSAIAMGDYAVDLHGAAHSETLEKYLGESRADKPKWRYGPFHIPFECLIPETVDGFMAAEKNISVTRLTNGATRLQPVTMRVGQAVGIIATLSAKNNIQPRDVNPIAVQWALLKQQIPLHIVANAPVTGYLSYKDVPIDNPVWKNVQMMGLHNMIAGGEQGVFGVDEPVTRIQMATILSRIDEMGLNIDKRLKPGKLTLLDKTYKLYLKVKAHLTGEDKPMSRSEFVAAVAKQLDLNTTKVSSSPIYTDVKSNHRSFKFIQGLHQSNLLEVFSTGPVGKPHFNPQKHVTRGEAAAFLTTVILKSNKI